MDWQLVSVAMIVAIAIMYLGRTYWRGWRGSKSGCQGGCGCASKTDFSAKAGGQDGLISPEQLTSRLRQPDRC